MELHLVMKVLMEEYAYELELLQVQLPDMASGGSALGKAAITENGSRQKMGDVMEDPENLGETLSFDLLFRGIEITTGGQRIYD